MQMTSEDRSPIHNPSQEKTMLSKDSLRLGSNKSFSRFLNFLKAAFPPTSIYTSLTEISDYYHHSEINITKRSAISLLLCILQPRNRHHAAHHQDLGDNSPRSHPDRKFLPSK
jgi:hypothetical protein